MNGTREKQGKGGERQHGFGFDGRCVLILESVRAKHEPETRESATARKFHHVCTIVTAHTHTRAFATRTRCGANGEGWGRAGGWGMVFTTMCARCERRGTERHLISSQISTPCHNHFVYGAKRRTAL